MSFWDRFTAKRPAPLDTVEWILRVTVLTLAMLMVAVVGALMFGLFNDSVDNDKIFELVGPAFNTIVGAFVGLLGGLSLNNVGLKPAQEEPSPLPPTHEPPLELTPEMQPAPKPYDDPQGTVFIDTPEEDDDDDMEPWEKYRNDLRYDANGDGVVDENDFPDWRSAGK
jgi:hypothetical protein